MDFSEFQRLSERTLKNAPDYLHVATLGLASEVGEICSEIKKAAEQHRAVDREKILEESGDAMWYLAAVLSVLCLPMDEAAVGNVGKLMRRYPNGFTPAASVERADKGATNER